MTGTGGAAARRDKVSAVQLREANEALVLATLHAQTMAAASDQAAARVRDANEHLVVATVHAQMLAELAEQAIVQLADRGRLEAQLMEVQKLETLALLAGGVAHDFNNLLTTIMGYTDLGRLGAAPGSDQARWFEAIDKTALKAGELTRQLMAYAGKGERRTVEVDLGIVVQEIAQLLTGSMPGHVTLRSDPADRLPFVKGDPTQIFQVVMNLITNAFEACPAGTEGRVTLRTRAPWVDAAEVASAGWALPVAPGHYASLEVTDNGSGMTPEVLARVLEPFFTTKRTGHGLGLAAVTGILRNHRGGLRVTSEPGRGSSFTLFLPAMAEPRELPNLETLPVWRGEGKLLIVEPEPELRDQARRLAERLGFTVLEAVDGPEAVELFRYRHGKLALVILALQLPNLGGAAVFQAMQAIDRQVPVVLSDRFSAPDPEPPLPGLAGRLKTPFRVAEFQLLLCRALGPQPAGTRGPA